MVDALLVEATHGGSKSQPAFATGSLIGNVAITIQHKPCRRIMKNLYDNQLTILNIADVEWVNRCIRTGE